MATDVETTELKAEIAKLRGEVADLRAGGSNGSKAEALFALQYDSLPDWYKSPRAVAIYKAIGKAVPFILILTLILFAFMLVPLIWDNQSAIHQRLPYDPQNNFSPKP